MILEKINKPEDIKNLDKKEKKLLASEVRELVLNTVSKNGGHLASNLGIVELTIALLSCTDLPKDKIIWDVGHQSYPYKILTDRKDRIYTLRKQNGIAGFPRTSESIYDSFDTGHSSTSISVALGMARARDLKKENKRVIAVIGDGALTGGMAMEALNDAGISKTNLIVVLNDNGMSISRNTGGMSRFLSKLRTKKGYLKSNSRIKNAVNKVPYLGPKTVRFIGKTKTMIKNLVIPKMYFENIGFTYLGPVDGHNIEDLEDIIRSAENLNGPVLIHALTIKGKGYFPAEKEPNKYHATSSFDIKVGKKEKKTDDYSSIMGKTLVKLAKKDKNIVAITAAMEEGTGLTEFKEKYKNRFFDTEIAEQHALTMAAGMAKEGLKPVVPIYSSFLQRGYDQIVHDICMQNLPVVICVDRAGIVGRDGETHQGLLDLSFLNTIPNMNIMAPKNYEELSLMLEFSLKQNKPFAIRYPRGTESTYKFNQSKKIEFGKGELIKEGNDITIVAIGNMVSKAMEVAHLLKNDNISTEVINARFAKPIDISLIEKSFKKTKKLVTIEDNNINGGFGQSIKANINTQGKIINLGYPDKFIKHGAPEEIEKQYGLDIETIYKRIKKEM